MFYVLHELEGQFVAYHIREWDVHWKAMNASFEEALNVDEDLQRFSGRIFLCGTTTIDYKPRCLISQEFNRMTSLGTLQWIQSC
jgi:hypothetical protein